MLAPHQQALIQNSVEALECTTVDLAAVFYGKLFELAPEVRTMFPEEMSTQINKLQQTLVYVLSTMNDTRTLYPVLDELGLAHQDLGATMDHYGVVGEALLSALSENVAGWNEDHHAAWSELYVAVSGRMLDAAAQSGRTN